MADKRSRNAPGEMSLVIDKFPQELHHRCKVRAAEQDVSLKDFTIKALQSALAEPVLDSAHEGGQGTVRRSSPKIGKHSAEEDL